MDKQLTEYQKAYAAGLNWGVRAETAQIERLQLWHDQLATDCEWEFCFASEDRRDLLLSAVIQGVEVDAWTPDNSKQFWSEFMAPCPSNMELMGFADGALSAARTASV